MDARRAQEFTMSGREWLEADGLGGYACGTDDGIRTRRYHALLCVATTPPTGRMVLVNGIEAWLETPTGPVFLSSHRYVPDVVAPDGARRIVAFTPEPWPTWTYALPGDRRVEHGVVVEPGRAAAGLYWRLCAGPPAVLAVRLLCSGRDHHALHRENPRFRFAAAVTSGRITIQTYPGLPAIVARTNGTYTHEPEWYRRFLYTEERARGLDCTEDLASPGSRPRPQADAALKLAPCPPRHSLPAAHARCAAAGPHGRWHRRCSLPRVGYEVLAVEVVGDEVIKLLRHGRRFRLVSTPRWPANRVLSTAVPVRRTFHTAEVAWCAFDFAVASERSWAARLAHRPPGELTTALARAAAAFRAAALRRHDPPGTMGLADVVARLLVAP
jgi:hypothetical protein